MNSRDEARLRREVRTGMREQSRLRREELREEGADGVMEGFARERIAELDPKAASAIWKKIKKCYFPWTHRSR